MTSDQDDSAPENTIKRVGAIKITDVETGESTTHATYLASEMLDLLDKGHSIDEIVSMLD